MAKKKYTFQSLNDILGDDVDDVVGVLGDNKEEILRTAESNTVPLSSMITNPFQPRKNFNQEELENLAESIKEHGLIQPIVVTKIDNSNFQIVAGERRFRASKIAGLTEVPVVVLKLNSLQIEELAIIENIQRVDLTDIEEAIAYNQMSKKLNLTQDQIATKIKKSRPYVANIMRLLKFPTNIQNALLEGKVTTGQVRPLLVLIDKPEVLNSLFKKVMEKNMTAREVEMLIKFQSMDGTGTKSEKPKSFEIKHLEDVIQKKLGTRVSIEKKKLVINYSNNKDLNRILEILDLLED
ncbi:chromosome partitioning protein ParB [Spiroplasma sp. TIUS-1]|uniref:ParB/RepB/Spo0J family partition protein n=1 Tax=Spiroplasma sp. TIUS-1 TaxID=216963 RepID=UPI0013975FF4|nr:ParB/RepB/Spo0J family partition protein [Spiroplasma sp. TIUS-1]QHX36220.1 chromosome partitioning protein ParB [Spiroplasma sp. TIUS-1]